MTTQPPSPHRRLIQPALVALALALGACSDGLSVDNSVQNPPSSPVSAPDSGEAAGAADRVPSAQFSDLPAPYNLADYERGRRTFRLCQSCHTLAQGAPHLVGPNLYGLFQRRTGTAPDYVYSDALRQADMSWTPARLDDWLANPRGFLPGNKMSFAGVRKPEDRVAVIAYIMTETGNGAPSGG